MISPPHIFRRGKTVGLEIHNLCAKWFPVRVAPKRCAIKGAAQDFRASLRIARDRKRPLAPQLDRFSVCNARFRQRAMQVCAGFFRLRHQPLRPARDFRAIEAGGEYGC